MPEQWVGQIRRIIIVFTVSGLHTEAAQAPHTPTHGLSTRCCVLCHVHTICSRHMQAHGWLEAAGLSQHPGTYLVELCTMHRLVLTTQGCTQWTYISRASLLHTLMSEAQLTAHRICLFSRCILHPRQHPPQHQASGPLSGGAPCRGGLQHVPLRAGHRWCGLRQGGGGGGCGGGGPQLPRHCLRLRSPHLGAPSFLGTACAGLSAARSSFQLANASLYLDRVLAAMAQAIGVCLVTKACLTR
jgi:hypothetical protein